MRDTWQDLLAGERWSSRGTPRAENDTGSWATVCAPADSSGPAAGAYGLPVDVVKAGVLVA